MTLQRILKTSGAIVTIAGIVGSVITFLYNSWQDVETRRLEARKPFLEEQLRLYTEAAQTVAILASVDRESPEFAEAEKRFWTLYWGELSLVESPNVESAMVMMGRCLHGDCSDCPRKPDIEHCALAVAHASRESLAESWGVTDWRYKIPKP